MLLYSPSSHFPRTLTATVSISLSLSLSTLALLTHSLAHSLTRSLTRSLANCHIIYFNPSLSPFIVFFPSLLSLASPPVLLEIAVIFLSYLMQIKQVRKVRDRTGVLMLIMFTCECYFVSLSPPIQSIILAYIPFFVHNLVEPNSPRRLGVSVSVNKVL